MAELAELVEAVGGLVTNTAVSLVILLTVFIGLSGAEWVAGRIQSWRQERRRRNLGEAGLSEFDLEMLKHFVDYEIKHYRPLKPALGLVAVVSLVVLAIRSSNLTGLVVSYGAMALVFSVLVVVESVRFRRAYRIHRRLETNPKSLVSAEDPYEDFEFVRPEEIVTLNSKDD